MDRRQKKTRKAIFEAFQELLEKKSYNSITVQDILDKADIGRSTFYAHFETKDDLLKALCQNLFDHIVSTAIENQMQQESHSQTGSVFCHLLMHLEENDSHILSLLSCQSSEIFLRCFKDSLADLVRQEFIDSGRSANLDLPEDFLIHHISSSFVEMILWWIHGGRKYSPEKLDQYFRAVIDPLLLP